jgi:hypothetical protein
MQIIGILSPSCRIGVAHTLWRLKKPEFVGFSHLPLVREVTWNFCIKFEHSCIQSMSLHFQQVDSQIKQWIFWPDQSSMFWIHTKLDHQQSALNIKKKSINSKQKIMATLRFDIFFYLYHFLWIRNSSLLSSWRDFFRMEKYNKLYLSLLS